MISLIIQSRPTFVAQFYFSTFACPYVKQLFHLFLCISAYSTAVAFLQIDDVDVKQNQRKKDFLSSEKVQKEILVITNKRSWNTAQNSLTIDYFFFAFQHTYSTAVAFLQINDVDVKKNYRKKGFCRLKR